MLELNHFNKKELADLLPNANGFAHAMGPLNNEERKEELLWKYSYPSKEVHEQNRKWLEDCDVLIHYEFCSDNLDRTYSYYLIKKDDKYYKISGMSKSDYIDPLFIDQFDPEEVSIKELTSSRPSFRLAKGKDETHLNFKRYTFFNEKIRDYLNLYFADNILAQFKAVMQSDENLNPMVAQFRL